MSMRGNATGDMEIGAGKHGQVRRCQAKSLKQMGTKDGEKSADRGIAKRKGINGLDP